MHKIGEKGQNLQKKENEAELSKLQVLQKEKMCG